MIVIYGKIRTLIYLLSEIDAFELESTVTHQKADIEIKEVAVGNLYHVYSMDFRYLDYGEYQYRATKDGVEQETGLIQIVREPDVVAPEDEPNIVMYDGSNNENTEDLR